MSISRKKIVLKQNLWNMKNLDRNIFFLTLNKKTGREIFYCCAKIEIYWNNNINTEYSNILILECTLYEYEKNNQYIE